MKISIVVPAYNEEKLINQSLAAIKSACAAFDPLGWTSEIVVCDNNSTDRTAALARAAGATVIFEPINQISRARNRGASAATGDWLIFVDADSFPSAALFTATAKRIASGQCAGGGCLVQMDEQKLFLKIAVTLWTILSRLKKWAAGSFVFCRADLFRELGGFSDQMFASEEIDFSDRLKKLARTRRLRFQIITEQKLVTSARKLHLYGHLTHLRFFLRAILSPRRTVLDRDRCTLWYDGRR